ncbi:MAG: hypothetical protein WB793_06915 [Candidatus Dormiibacterota bacterium]
MSTSLGSRCSSAASNARSPGVNRTLSGPSRRCPYLEQIIKESAGPFGLLTRYKADCHVDRRTHRFTGRHPVPPCISEPESCSFYQSEHGEEDDRIRRYAE